MPVQVSWPGPKRPCSGRSVRASLHAFPNARGQEEMNMLADRYILWRVRPLCLHDGLLYDDCPSLVRVEGRSGSTDLAGTRALCTVGITLRSQHALSVPRRYARMIGWTAIYIDYYDNEVVKA